MESVFEIKQTIIKKMQMERKDVLDRGDTASGR